MHTSEPTGPERVIASLLANYSARGWEVLHASPEPDGAGMIALQIRVAGNTGIMRIDWAQYLTATDQAGVDP